MDDNLSTKSSDSLTTSGEYEIVSETPSMAASLPPAEIILNEPEGSTESDIKFESNSPTLNIANNGDYIDLKNDMTEVIKELDKIPDLDAFSNEFEFLIDTSGYSSDVPKFYGYYNDLKAELLDALVEDTKSYENLLIPFDQYFEGELQTKCCMEKKKITIPTKSLTLPLPLTASKINQQEIQQATPSPLFSDTKPLSLTLSGLSTPDCNRVGHSIFYDCIDLMSPMETNVNNLITTDFKTNDVNEAKLSYDIENNTKPEHDIDDTISDKDKGTKFSGITYLGSRLINDSKSEIEIYEKMAELNHESETGWHCTVSIPNDSAGSVVLRHSETDEIEESCEINKILFYLPGSVNTNTQACFAFTWSHDEKDSIIYKCYVFRCNIPEAVDQVSSCFSKAFQMYPASLTGSITSVNDNNSALMMSTSITCDQSGNPLTSANYEFVVALAIGEKSMAGTKRTYSAVPKDKDCFKLRCNTDKEISITVKQTPSSSLKPLYIERCFGVLLSPGKLIRQADMQLLDLISMNYQKPIGVASGTPFIPLPLTPYLIRAGWGCTEKGLEQFNSETTKMSLTVAVDLVIRGIQEPVRFVIETPVTIHSQNDFRLMDHFITKRSMQKVFYLHLKKNEKNMWVVNSIDFSDEIIEPNNQSSSSILKSINNLSRMVRSSSAISIEENDCPTDYSSDDEPLLSGTGEVSKDCSQDTLDEWDPVLKEWNETEKRPKNLAGLVRLGIPEALRGRVWQKLANVENKTDMSDMYRILITKETKCEAVILRDINRTFPAHKRFKESGGSGQDSLFKVSKAYAVRDSEVGYCQGLSFIAASLLIHMPEEDAFSVLEALMYDYGLRELYKQGFETLYIRLHQLDRLINELLPKLHEHFLEMGVETHMFAAQWFLTLFTSRFPLYFVFHVLDVFMLDGFQFLFQVAITLLSNFEQDLRKLDFEGILKYFRVSLPKKCRSSKEARRILKMACERKIKKLKQYEEEYLLNKRNEERLQKDQEIYEKRFSTERNKYKTEIKDLSSKLDEASNKLITEEKRRCNIVQDYKQIIQRQEQQITKLNDMLEELMKAVAVCETCSNNVHSDSPIHKKYGNKILECAIKKNDETDPLNPLHIAQQRIRELELELAQAKLAHVEAECKNQDLNHQLTTTLNEIQTNNRSSWQPWLSKTINTIQEKVTTRRDNIPTFQSYTQDSIGNQEKNPGEISPKLQSRVQNNLSNRNSIDILPKDRPILRETLSFTNK